MSVSTLLAASRKRAVQLLATSAIGLIPLVVTGTAQAVGTRAFVFDSMSRFSDGDLKGVAVASDGVVRAGWTLGKVALPNATAAFTHLVLNDGSVLIGTSPDGKVFKVTGDQATLFAETKEMAVSVLLQDAKGNIYAAASSNKIYKLSQGKADVFATLPKADAEHVWALALNKEKTHLLAGTGPKGKIMSIPLGGGAPSVYLDTEEPHIVSLTLDDKGTLYAGSSGKGILYRVTGPGKADVIFDFPGDGEVRQLTFGPGGLYALVNGGGGYRTSSYFSRGGYGRGGSLYRFDSRWLPDRIMNHGDSYTTLVFDKSGKPYVGTSGEGRVYTVNEKRFVTMLVDVEEKAVAGIGVGDRPFVITSDSAAFRRVTQHGGPDTIWTSRVYDAGIRANFGRVSWKGEGRVSLSLRTGNTSKPDATWSAWSADLNAPARAQIGGRDAEGRYVQVRARWADAKSTLSEVIVPFITDNMPHTILNVKASQGGRAFGTTGEGLVASGSSSAPHHSNTVSVSWRTDNPDGDTLRYKVAFKREGQTTWRELQKPEEYITHASYSWNTVSLLEGKYKIRVDSDDSLSNPPDKVMRASAESEWFVVDNAPPEISGAAMDKRRLKLKVKDRTSFILRVEVSVDSKTDFKLIRPRDGMYDSQEEEFDYDLSAIVPPGSHTVTIRAYDAMGNMTVAEVDAR